MGNVGTIVATSLLLAVSAATTAAADKAPVIRLPDTNGAMHNIDYSAADITLVHFWASWCKPCKEEMPQLIEFAKSSSSRNAQIIAIAADNAKRTRKFFAAEPVKIKLLIDQYGSSVYDFGVAVIPETYVINNKGRITHHLQGKMNWLDKNLVTKLKSLDEITMSKD